MLGSYQKPTVWNKSKHMPLVKEAASASDKHLCKRLWHTAVAGIADVYLQSVKCTLLFCRNTGSAAVGIKDSIAAVPEQLKWSLRALILSSAYSTVIASN